jgi:sugar lactone lactonase YvrE
MRLLPSVLLALLVSCAAFGQAYTISTFAGGALPVNIPGTSASLNAPRAVAVDGSGNIFFVDENDVLRLDATTGVVTLAAGNGTAGFSGDNGPATSAQLSPVGVAVDSVGNLYIADTVNNRIREVSNGVITTVAGGGSGQTIGDNGPATSASIYSPYGVAVDSVGNLYITDTSNNLIRKVSNGVITTVAGSLPVYPAGPGVGPLSGDNGDNGPATSALLSDPEGVAVDSAGNLYIAETANSRVRKVSNGVITTVAGNGTEGFSGDNGPAISAQLNGPQGVAVDSAGNLYIADKGNSRIRKVSNGVITTVAGNGTPGYSGDNGPATGAQLAGPWGVAVDSTGNLYIADGFFGNSDTIFQGNRIREVSNGVITTVAGGGTLVAGGGAPSGDNGPATSVQLYLPSSVALDSAGNVYIADTGNNRIRKVANGVITTVAGNGTAGFSGDNGPATGAQLALPESVAVDSAFNLYIADNANNRIRKVSNGVITTVAGSNGTHGFSGDNGPATSAELNSPQGVAVDSAGNLYIADYLNFRVRKVTNGVITTVAGNGMAGFDGDNGPATSAQLYGPSGLAVDSAGNLYIADYGNNRIRKVSNGVITTVAGVGFVFPPTFGDNGPAASAQLSSPDGVAVDSAGNLYIADTGDYLIRKVANGVITSVAGNAFPGGFSGDNGPATSAPLNEPQGVAVDSAGNVYIADTGNNRIRLLTPSASSCTPSVEPTSLQGPGSSLQVPASGGSFNLSVQTAASCSWAVSGLPNWIAVSGASTGSGPATVTFAVAPNTSGAALNATISVAGVSFTVTQASS